MYVPFEMKRVGFERKWSDIDAQARHDNELTRVRVSEGRRYCGRPGRVYPF